MTPPTENCFHCNQPLIVETNTDRVCKSCVAPDGWTSYCITLIDSRAYYVSIYFHEIGMGVNIRFEDNQCHIFTIDPSATDRDTTYHKVQISLDCIPEFDFFNRDNFINQLRIYATFS